MNTIETDYLVVGAGAAGMAFTDALIAHGDADVVMVDRRHAPGGHWHDAYPFVRLHQPSATYGVDSRPLGNDAIDTIGSDAGLYERAGAPEICGYFRKVLDEALLPSGRVHFHGLSDYLGDFTGEHVFRSRLTGVSTRVRVRRKVVDTTYLEVSVPANHTPSFAVDPGARFMPVGDLVHQTAAPSGYTILGGGKTGMDACCWLLEHGVPREAIRWVRPRDAWVLLRTSFQPLELAGATLAHSARGVEVLAGAHDIDDLFLGLEAAGLVRRFDRTVTPTMFRGAILSQAECDALERIDQVVRLGRICRLGPTRIELEHGEIPSDPHNVLVDCTASGFRVKPERPIFEPGRITLQGLIGGFTCFSAATIGFVEATCRDDAARNRRCTPTRTLNEPVDWIRAYVGARQLSAAGREDPALGAWLARTRLSTSSGIPSHAEDPQVVRSLARLAALAEPALRNAERLLASARG